MSQSKKKELLFRRYWLKGNFGIGWIGRTLKISTFSFHCLTQYFPRIFIEMCSVKFRRTISRLQRPATVRHKRGGRHNKQKAPMWADELRALTETSIVGKYRAFFSITGEFLDNRNRYWLLVSNLEVILIL